MTFSFKIQCKAVDAFKTRQLVLIFNLYSQPIKRLKMWVRMRKTNQALQWVYLCGSYLQINQYISVLTTSNNGAKSKTSKYIVVS